MDFFQAQEQAKRSTSLLVVLFAAAVITLVIVTNILAMAAFGYINFEQGMEFNAQYLFSQFDWRAFAFISAIVCFVIFSGSAYKQISLGEGGKVIAESLGGSVVNHSTASTLEKRLLNVVEEMAIAAGTPVPGVYILDSEPGINAFAAGFDRNDAVIGITRGALESLDRDQLQGVIAHEFSHILNGDMRINLQLVALLHGILVIGFIGYYLLHAGRGSSKNGNATAILGLGLVAIGYGGHFFGNIIKASISRQREYLADASAVQFTRNKQGIGEALYKIRNASHGSYIEQPDAVEYTHGFFATGVHSFASRLFATHPPLDERISRIDPHLLLNKANADKKPMRKVAESSTTAGSSQSSSSNAIDPADVAILSVLSQAGNINEQQLDYAHQLVNSFSDDLYRESHEPVGAVAIVCCLLISQQQDTLNKQLNAIQESDFSRLIDKVFSLRQQVEALAPGYRLPLIDLLNPALKQLSAIEVERFRELVDQLVNADENIERFEWVLQQVVFQHLQDMQPKTGFKKYLAITEVEDAVHCIFSLVLGATEHGLTEENLEKLRQFSDLFDLKELTPDAVSLETASASLQQLNHLGFGDKEKVIKGCLFVIGIDGIFSIQEYELVRAIADVLQVPLPPDFKVGTI
ncbi:M48 family metallopeptidase [Thalassotalea sp. PS06]|uniref:M48 family metallopeptidase n=1 Tax=Thalassotalea sp. PS06 TaxID=2594005 RepID=UPI0011622A33|nr:M48 family metallopeptidase [Thalassotalea sp. PS06]QDP01363.1 M48 family metallopeptidase [Thalassotalea sp. PS06]